MNADLVGGPTNTPIGRGSAFYETHRYAVSTKSKSRDETGWSTANLRDKRDTIGGVLSARVVREEQGRETPTIRIGAVSVPEDIARLTGGRSVVFLLLLTWPLYTHAPGRSVGGLRTILRLRI